MTLREALTFHSETGKPITTSRLNGTFPGIIHPCIIKHSFQGHWYLANKNTGKEVTLECFEALADDWKEWSK